jgi:hypothetical protein
VRTSAFDRYALWIPAAVVLLIGCGANLNAPPGSKYVPSALSLSRGISEASSYRVLHDFSGRDGAYPLASLVEVRGKRNALRHDDGRRYPWARSQKWRRI